MPLVSVIIPTLNFNELFYIALHSVLAQTVRDLEVIIVLNTLTEVEIEHLYKVKAIDTRIKVVVCRKMGVAHALNAGLDAVTAPFVARMDSDDICHPMRLQYQLEFLNRNTSIFGVGSYAEYIDKNSKVIGTLRTTKIKNIKDMKATLRYENPYVHPTMLLRTQALKELKYNVQSVGCEDWDLWVRYSSRNYLIVNIPRKLLWYRLHEKQETQKPISRRSSNALVGALNRLTPSPTEIYPFQRERLNLNDITLTQVLKLMVREFPRITNVFSLRKFLTSIMKAWSTKR